MYHQRFKSVEDRFLEKFDRASDDECWVWRSGVSRPDEHPKFWVHGRYRRASHFAWEMDTGEPLGAGAYICHRCDNPRCVNPKHLFLGDHFLNMADKVRKGRSHRPSGPLNGRAVMTYHLAETIRRRYVDGSVSQERLAKDYGVGQSTISRILRNESWVRSD